MLACLLSPHSSHLALLHVSNKSKMRGILVTVLCFSFLNSCCSPLVFFTRSHAKLSHQIMTVMELLKGRINSWLCVKELLWNVLNKCLELLCNKWNRFFFFVLPSGFLQFYELSWSKLPSVSFYVLVTEWIYSFKCISIRILFPGMGKKQQL